MIFDPRFVKILKDKFRYDEYTILTMRQEFMELLLKVQTNQALIFIDEKNLQTEADKIDELSDPDASVEQQTKNLETLTRYLFELSEKYPELQQRVEKIIRKLNQDMAEDFFKRLDDDTLVEISTWLTDDYKTIKDIKQFISEHKTTEIDSTPSES